MTAARASDARTTRWRPWVKRAVVLVLGVLALRIAVGLVGSVDWVRVWHSFSRLSWWMVLVLLAVLAVRQVCNAVPLAVYVPGLGLGRSVQNDLSANLIGTVARAVPGPGAGDRARRAAGCRAAAVGRRRAQRHRVGGHPRRAAPRSPGERLAAAVGRSAGRVVQRFRPVTDPGQWAATLARISTSSAETLHAGLWRAVAALVAMVVADGLLLLLALRFVGVGTDALTRVDVLSAFLLAYPLTLMPLFGFGILDAALLATWVTIAGTEHEPAIVAGLVVWRAVALLGPLVAGAGALTWWRRAHPSRAER